MSMRILHVIANIAPRLGGPSKVVLEMSAALAAHGHVVEIITTTLQDRGSWFPRRVRAERLELQGGRRLVRAGYWVTWSSTQTYLTVPRRGCRSGCPATQSYVCFTEG